MKVQVNVNLGTDEFGEHAKPEGVHDLPKSVAERIQKRGLGVILEEPEPAKPASEPEKPKAQPKRSKRASNQQDKGAE